MKPASEISLPLSQGSLGALPRASVQLVLRCHHASMSGAAFRNVLACVRIHLFMCVCDFTATSGCHTEKNKSGLSRLSVPPPLPLILTLHGWGVLPCPSAGKHGALPNPETTSAAGRMELVGEDLSQTSPSHTTTVCCFPWW